MHVLWVNLLVLIAAAGISLEQTILRAQPPMKEFDKIIGPYSLHKTRGACAYMWVALSVMVFLKPQWIVPLLFFVTGMVRNPVCLLNLALNFGILFILKTEYLDVLIPFGIAVGLLVWNFIFEKFFDHSKVIKVDQDQASIRLSYKEKPTE
jgi:hypothetical protein